MQSNLAEKPEEIAEVIVMSPEEEAANRAALVEKLAGIIGGLDKLAKEQVTKRQHVENRWISDQTQFYGQYDQDTLKNLGDNNSQVFVNLTKNKVNGWEARLSDMLFPTDEKNWGIKPTPVPELATAVKNKDPNVSNAALVVVEEANTRAAAMELEISDQFTTSHYNIKSRQVIHHACVLGTGVIKGPVVANKVKKRWQAHTGQDGKVMHVLDDVSSVRPDFVVVDPLNYFPEMDARNTMEKTFDFERHLLTKKSLRELARLPGFDKDAVRSMIREGELSTVPDFVNQMRSIVQDGAQLEKRYEVWEYHGPIDGDDLRTICECVGDVRLMQDFEEVLEDPLKEMLAVVWFGNGKLLKFGAHPLDSGESLYSVFNLEKDDNCIFGFGIPHLMRDSQRALNAAWRMIMDNSALSTGPQIIVNKSIVSPADGRWELTPRKIWYAEKLRAGQSLDHAFKTASIDGNQTEMINVIKLAKQFADDETNLPAVAQGESGSHQTQTSGGMSMLMNSVNVVFRRVVKNWDDDYTTQNLRRIYDWNMQHSQKEEIKGDYDVDARGSSVLLVREVQAQNLMQIALQFSNHPVLGRYTKTVSLYRKLIQAHMIPANDVVKSDDEIAADEKAAQQNPPPPDPEMEKIKMQLQVAQLKANTDIQVANMNRDTEMIKIAEKKNMSLEDIRGKLMIAKTQTDSKERQVAGEMGLKKEMGSGI